MCLLTVVVRPGVRMSCWLTSLSITRRVADGIWTEGVLTLCWSAKRPAKASHHMPAPNSSLPDHPTRGDGVSRCKPKMELKFLLKPHLLLTQPAGVLFSRANKA